jgi:DNA-binding NtrC family response regulator
MFLRVLQERQIERLGSNRPVDVDVRIVSASLRPLEEEIDAGTFRKDLYFRINTVAIHLPPLRERREDIPILAQAFLQEFAAERNRPIEGFDDTVLEIFDAFEWTGNVRELRNVVERAVLFCKTDRVTIDELPTAMRAGRTSGGEVERLPAERVVTLQQAVEEAEIEAIRAALHSTSGASSRCRRTPGSEPQDPVGEDQTPGYSGALSHRVVATFSAQPSRFWNRARARARMSRPRPSMARPWGQRTSRPTPLRNTPRRTVT